MRAERIYRALLRILPREFREDTQAEVLDVFRACDDRARRRGWIARIGVWCRLLLDLVVTATAEWFHRADTPRDFRRTPAMTIAAIATNAAHDFRDAFRRLWRTPAWTSIASGTLAVGLAASLVGGVLMRDIVLEPLPFPEADRLVRLIEISDDGRGWWPSFPNAREWREHARAFDGVGIGGSPRIEPIALDKDPLRVPVAGAAAGFFETLQVTPVAGRLFHPGENRPGGPAVAVVTHRFWRNAMQGRPLSETTTIAVGRERFTVVGVLPPSFRYLGEAGVWMDPADVWLPLERETTLGHRTSHGNYQVVARLARGVSLEQARASMNELAQTLKAQHRERTNADSVRLTPLKDVVVRQAREPIQLLLYAGLGVLLVSCLNLATAILSQGLARAGELHIRQAIGATRGRLAAHLLAGAAALALPGTILGILLAGLAVRLLRVTGSASWPRLDEVGIDPPAVAAAFGVAGITAILAGLLPSVLLSSRVRHEYLRQRGEARGRHEPRLWSVFVGVQVALTVALLAGTGLLVRSFQQATRVDLGYNPRGVIAMDVTLPIASYGDRPTRIGFYQRAADAIRALPGVEAVGLTHVLPQNTTAYTSGTWREGSDPKPVMAGYRLVDDGYFDVLEIPRLQRDGDPFARGGVYIDRRLTALQWDGQVPLGDRVRIGFAAGASTVLGVVGTIREWDQGEDTVGAVYTDFTRHPTGLLAMHILARVRGDAASFADTARATLRQIDPLVPVEIGPLDARVESALDGRRLLLLIAGGFGASALLLATASVYALIAFAVARGRREAAIRLALGAGPGELRRRVLVRGVAPAAIGATVGLASMLPLGSAIRAQLFHVEPTDPTALAAAAMLILLVAALACAAPARRLSRVQPAEALRDE